MFLKIQNEYKIVNGDQDDIQKRLKANVYKVEIRNSFFSRDTFLIPIEQRKGMRMLTAGVFAKINKYIEDFLDPAMYAARNFLGSLHKLPILLYGTQGSGKTQHALLWAYKLVEERDAIGLVVNDIRNIDLPELIDAVREKEPDRLVVLILDEFEKSGSSAMVSTDMLSFLDGPDSKNNLLLIATCNEIYNMPDLLLDRPGRFEKTFTLLGGNKDVLYATVESLLPVEYKERIDIDHIVNELVAAEKWTVDYVRILIRNAIAELINLDTTNTFKEFNGIFDIVENEDTPTNKNTNKESQHFNEALADFKEFMEKLKEKENDPCYNCKSESCDDCLYYEEKNNDNNDW